jgi:pimeloyl-ACP methyl ester carboxylesterase
MKGRRSPRRAAPASTPRESVRLRVAESEGRIYGHPELRRGPRADQPAAHFAIIHAVGLVVVGEGTFSGTQPVMASDTVAKAIREAGHCVNLEQSEAFDRAVLESLRSRWRARRRDQRGLAQPPGSAGVPPRVRRPASIGRR